MNAGWEDKCGVIGVSGVEKAAELAFFGLYALQHRGQEGAGIVSFHEERHYSVRGMGLVSDVFDRESLAGLPGNMAVGHNRYSTTGSCRPENQQPLLAHFRGGVLALAHNGNLVNAWQLRQSLEEEGAIFQTSMDTEVIVHLVARSRSEAFVDRVREALRSVRGAYSLVLSDGRRLIAARDPHGFRPLCLGRLDGGLVVASESCALDLIGAEYDREIAPGEMLVIEDGRVRSIDLNGDPEPRHCIFEYIYFSRPDSIIFGHPVDPVRRRLGHVLAEEHPAEADIAIGVPDSSNMAALGYAERAGIRFEMGLIRNHYVGRTFIQPTQHLRDLRVRVKFNTVRDVLEGKRVAVVDDSIVRGTTMRKLVKMIRRAGAAAVHLRISSPPIRFPCFYGIDTPTRGELIAATHTVEKIGRYLAVDSVGYLSLEGLLRAVPEGLGYCAACFDGRYPIPFDENQRKEILEKYC
ncbi:MAG: amidophosphoribosyltransferase [Candidatus Eisenbacteria bacterium]|nr:amidophosphoribosyltransferase [Candidatus Eisenbacteria bacterium]